MKIFVRFAKLANIFFVILISGVLVSCGGSGGSFKGNVNAEGQAADGYLYLATAFLDLDEDGVLDSDEPSATTGTDGSYILSATSEQISTYSVVVTATAGVTIDQDSPNETVTEAFTMSSPPGDYSFVSPLTTEVHARMNELTGDAATNKAAALAAIKSDYGLSDDINLMGDHIAAKAANPTVYQAVHNIAASITSVLKIVERDTTGLNLKLRLKSAKTNIAQYVAPQINTIKNATSTTSAKNGMIAAAPMVAEIRISDFIVYTGKAVTVKGKAQHFNQIAASDVTSSWSFSGGSQTQNADGSYTVTFSTAGDYTVTLNLTHSDGRTASKTETITVVDPTPTAPTITTSKKSASIGESISFSASSTDPGGSTITYTWNFGDSSTGSGASVSHAYSNEGTYTVTATATNTFSKTASSTTTVKVAGTASGPANLTFTIPGSGVVGSAVSMSANASDASGCSLTYSWNFGDNSSGSGASTSHTYTSAGSYTVTVRALCESSGLYTEGQNVITISASSGGGSSSGSSGGNYLASCQNEFAPACSGTNCTATSATSLTGSGYGIWCYDNATSSTASLDISVGGVANSQVATFVFTNPTMTDLNTVPSVGSLSSPVTTPPADGMEISSEQSLGQKERDRQRHQESSVHLRITEKNKQMLDYWERVYDRVDRGERGISVEYVRPQAELDRQLPKIYGDKTGATVTVGSTTDTFWERYHCADQVSGDNSGNGCIQYTVTARAKCDLSTGRRVVFWIQSSAIADTLSTRSSGASDGAFGSGNMYTTAAGSTVEQVSQADLDILTKTVCSPSDGGGAFDKIVGLTGDFWTTNDTYYSNIIDEETSGNLLDVNVVIVEPEICVNATPDTADKNAGCNAGWAGYYSSANSFKTSSYSKSNQSLVFYIDASGVAQSPQFYVSTLVHEAMHMINKGSRYYGRVAAGNATSHETWLEEQSAIGAEDVAVPQSSKSAWGTGFTQGSYPEGYSKLQSVRIPGYIGCTTPQDLAEWASLGSSACAYGMAGAFGGFLNRRYGVTDYFSEIFKCTGANSETSWTCLNNVIIAAGGKGIDDELARMGASVFTTVDPKTSKVSGNGAGLGISDTGLPLGFGYPERLDSGKPELYGLDLNSSYISRGVHDSISTFKSTSHWFTRHHLYDSSGNSTGDTLSVTGIQIPAGTSMMLIIK